MTARARVAINRALREKEKEEFISLGDQILSYAFRREEVELSPEILKIVCNVLDIQDVNALKMLVGKNQLSVRKVMCVLCPDKEDEPTFDKEHLESENDSERAIIQIISDYRVGIKKSSEIRDVASICFSECCCPLPGENIIGIREPDESLSIHSSDCRTLEKYEGASECWCDVVWHPEASERRRYSACIDATLSSQFSALGSICTLIGLNKANILSVNIGERDKDIFKVIIDIEISGVRHLNNIISSLKDHSEVRMVRRFQGIMCAAKNDGQNTNISHKNIKNAD
jgi:(p)ppGpp synthase/HD superfamily hydrolase